MKKLSQYICTWILAITLSCITSSYDVFAKSSSPVTVYCNDSIAGYTGEAQVKTLKESNISFMLETPRGRKVFLQELSDKNGNLNLIISDYHLQTSGDYKLSARFAERNEDYGKKCNFTVYPGDVSEIKSRISTSQKTAEAGLIESIVIEVQLIDTYGNAVKGHSVEILSSRTEDEIQLLSQLPYTDDNGTIAFLLTSEEPGMSTISAIDLTEGITLDTRSKVAFIEPNLIKNIGGKELGNFEYDSYFGDASIFLTSVENEGEIYEFIIDINPDKDNNVENQEAQIIRNKASSATITAVDELGNIVPNYMGTIRFSSTDDNATLPEDYTFTAEDLGIHDFDLGLTFKAEGTHVLSVNDTTHFNLKGEIEFEVVPEEITATEIMHKEVTLSSPKEGIYSNKNIQIKGSTSPHTTLQIFDRDILQREIQSDESGSFDALLTNTAEGEHEFYVATLDKEGNILSESKRIAIAIDSEKPVIESFNIIPQGVVEAASEITVSITSEANLSKSTMLVEDQIIELTEAIDNPGVYNATFDAPSDEGQYNIDIILEDNVGNQATFAKQTILEVETQDKTIAPTQVTEISAVESNQRVTLTWAASEDDTYISKYKISYGFGPEELYLDVQTFDSSTTWYIPNLENGQEYYFGIQGIDSEGNEGPMSELIKASAKAPEPKMPASLEDPVILEEMPPKTPETGPELWLMIITSLLLVDIYYRKKSAV